MLENAPSCRLIIRAAASNSTEQADPRESIAARGVVSNSAVLIEEHSLVAASEIAGFGSLLPGRHFAGSARDLRQAWFAHPLLIVALAALLVVPRSAHAIIDKSTQNNTTPIGEDASWSGGDPGWDSVTVGEYVDGQGMTHPATNYTYIGDNWIIAARHSGIFSSHFSTGTYAPISGQNFGVPNPLDWPVTLTTQSDLRLIRIKGDPGGDGVPAATVASQPPPVNGQVVYIGGGRARAAGLSNWNVNTTTWDWGAPFSGSGGNYHGYQSTASHQKSWGTNRISSDDIVTPDEDDEPVNPAHDSDWDYVIHSKDPDNNFRDKITLLTSFDQSGDPHEAQALSGDSSGAVFYKRNGQWELSGVVSSVFIFENQPGQTAVFGDLTAFSDLSAYYDEIMAIIDAHSGDFASKMGDINLDGQVLGDGTGSAASDDVTAFVEGWLEDNSTGIGNIVSWQKGDLSLDGKTDLTDFLLMRNALLGAGSGAGASALSSLLGMGPVATVPEPSSAALLLVGAMFLLGAARRRVRGAAS